MSLKTGFLMKVGLLYYFYSCRNLTLSFKAYFWSVNLAIFALRSSFSLRTRALSFILIALSSFLYLSKVYDFFSKCSITFILFLNSSISTLFCCFMCSYSSLILSSSSYCLSILCFSYSLSCVKNLITPWQFSNSLTAILAMSYSTKPNKPWFPSLNS